MFAVLVHPALYQRLRRGSPALRSRVHKVLARLREGRWSGGTRVKRLRGAAHPVYEARTDGGDRLLFTIARHPTAAGAGATGGEPAGGALHLQIWDLVEHDDVDRAARRTRAPEAGFLALSALEEFEISEPPPYPDAPFDAWGGTGDEDSLLRFLVPDGAPAPAMAPAAGGGEGSGGGAGGGRSAAGPAPRNVGWYPIEADWLSGEARFQQLLDGAGDQLALQLDAEQRRILHAPGPLLLAGGAGSGKTTLAVYRLAAAALAPGGGRALYVSCSPALVERARRLYDDLAALHAAGGGGAAAGGAGDAGVAAGTLPRRPDFFTFDDLYATVVGREFGRHRANLMTEEAFEEWFRRAGRPLDPALVWEEVRGILKGACLVPGASAMLGADHYFELGRKRAPLFVDLRPQIYKIAERYQQWLAEEGRLDSIDLCRLALAELRRRRGGPYDVVICDEVQDLTEIEVGFVLALSARDDLAGVMLTGDAQQVLNPSGFRWAEVRRLAARRTRRQAPPAVHQLRDPTRSTAPLSALAGALLALRRELCGRGDEGDDEQPADAPGPFPVEIWGSAAEIAAALTAAGTQDPAPDAVAPPAATGGPDGSRAVLVGGAAAVAELRPRLPGWAVLTVAEAKGLEFDTVVLWRLLAAEGDLVDRFLRGESRGEREARLGRLLRRLYVAATRARRCLAVYEGAEPHPFWGRAAVGAALDRLPARHLARAFRGDAAPGDWERDGDRFAAQDLPRQAAECYRRAGLPERQAATLAQADEARGDWAAALARWQALGAVAPEREAPLLERLGRFADAAGRWRDAGRRDAAARCELLQLERRGAWIEAARGWEELADHAAAARCWAAAGQRRAAAAAAARAAEAGADWPAAATVWLELGEHERAARAFAAAGDRRGATHAAALAHQAAGRWAQAAAAFRAAGRRQDAHTCLAQAFEAAGRPRQAARQWLRLADAGSHRRAVDQLVAAGDWLQVARLEPAAGGSEGTAAPAAPESRILAHLRQLLAAADAAAAGELLGARHAALVPRLPEVPWFLADAAGRRVRAELHEVERLELRRRALAAEAAGAHSRAARCWRRAGDAPRAAAAFDRRVAALDDPLRQVRAWWLTGDADRRRHAAALAAAGGARAALLTTAVAALDAEDQGLWQAAAERWTHIGRRADAARCLARLATFLDDALPPVRGGGRRT